MALPIGPFSDTASALNQQGSPAAPNLPKVSDDDKKVTPPKNLLTSESALRTTYTAMQVAHIKRCFVFARIQGMLDGNAPHNPRELNRLGVGYLNNVNWRDGEANLEMVSNPFWSLFNDVEFLAEFVTELGSPQDNPVWGRIASEEWSKVVRSWKPFQARMNIHQSEMLKFGLSAILYPDKDNWQFTSIENYRFLVPDKTLNETGALDKCAIEHPMKAKDLWEIYLSIGPNSKWNKEALGQLLWETSTWYLNKTDKDQSPTGNNFMNLQIKIRNGEICYDEIYTTDLLMVSELIQESDGKITKAIIHSQLSMGKPLYYADRLYNDWSETLQVFSLTPGENYMHGNKGYGHKMFNIIEATTRLDNSLFDGARMGSTVLVSTKAGRGKDLREKRMTLGGFVDIGEAEYKQSLMGANLAPQIQVSRYFQEKLQINNAMTGMDPRTMEKMGAQVQRTLTAREARIQKMVLANYIFQLDFHYRNMVRKMLIMLKSETDKNDGYKYAKEWKDNCVARGVPKEFFDYDANNVGLDGLPKHMDVSATRTGGSGSQAADQLETQEMMGMLPTLGERGRVAVLEDRISAIRGYRWVRRYMPLEDRNEQPTGEETLVSIENNQLEQGEEIVVSPDNNQAVHAIGHLNRMAQIAKAFREQQYSLQDTDRAFRALGPHTTRHLLYLQQDTTRAALVSDLRRQWAVLANFGDMIANNAQEERQAMLREQEKQQAALAEQMARGGPNDPEMVKVQKDAEIKMVKLREEIRRSALRDQFKFLLERQKTSFDDEIKRSKAIAEIAREDAEVVAEIRRAGERERNTGKSEEALY